MSIALATRPSTISVPFIAGPQRLVWQDQVVEAPAPGRLLVRCLRSLISPGTELAFWNGIHPCIGDPSVAWAQWPFAPGYAALGVVEEVGDGVDGFAPGDRVLCSGRHAPWITVDPANALLAKVPEAVTDAHAPFARLLQIVAGTSEAVAGRPAGTVVVVGAGLIGVLAALWLRSDGIAAVIEDLDPARRAAATACGLEARPPQDNDQPAVVVDATGVADLVPGHLARVARGGRVVLLGSPRVPVMIDIYRHIHGKCAMLCGAHEGRYPLKGELSRQSLFAEALARLADGRIAVAPLAARTIAPDQLDAAYRALAARTPGWLGVAVEWCHE